VMEAKPGELLGDQRLVAAYLGGGKP